MQSTFKKEPHSIIKLEVALTKEEFNEYWTRAYESARGEVHIKGFRPGNAPSELADKAINKEKVFDDAANEAVRFSLQEIADKERWVLIDKPKIEVTEANPLAPQGEKEAKEKTGLTYKAELVVFPEVTLGDYKKTAHDILQEKKEVTVEDKEVEDALKWLQNSRAKLTRKTGVVEKGDVVEADVSAKEGEKEIPGSTLSNDRFVVGESRFIPGFDSNLIGKKEGEAIVFPILAPQDYWQESLRGKEITFTVKINSLYTRELPALDDAFAKGLGPSFQTIDNVKTNIKKGVIHEKQEKQKHELRSKLLEALVKEISVDPPQIMIDRTLENLVFEAKTVLRQSGREQEYTDKKLRTELAERAKEQVLAQLVIHKLAQTEHLEPNPEEVKAYAESKNLDPEKHYDYSYGNVLNEKVFSFLESEHKDK